jgi:hypothetical protein
MKNFSLPVMVIFVLIACCSNLNAQESDKTDPRVEAHRNFSEEKYTEALPMYRQLLNEFPKEPEYLFCTGVCLVQLNGDMEEAIRLLRTVTGTDYSPLSWLFLGRALHLYYAFDDAIKAYSRFILKGKAAEIEQYDVERLIEMARNGIEYTRLGYPVMVQQMETVKIDELYEAAAINGTGKLMKKPIEFCSKTDIRNGYKPWMFLPAFTEINEYIFVSGYEPGKKNNKQIFRIRNLNHETWGFPEPLNESVNTVYDEEFPYFDVRSSTLYFSSKGHSSMGGYDIFKSVYDWNSKTWSKPENMGFPVNSPYDDFVYITDEFSHSASFISTRAAQPGLVNIYCIKPDQDAPAVRFLSVDEIRQASRLQVSIKPAEPAISAAIITTDAVIADSSVHMSVNPSALKTDYNKKLAMALQLQLRADSAARTTRDLRILAKETPNDSTKKQLISDILKNDKEAKSLQREADLLFSEARKLKENIPLATTRDNDTNIVLSGQVNGIKIYQYKSGIGQDNASPELHAKIPAPVINQVKTDVFSHNGSFQYSDADPIPAGLKHDQGLVYHVQLGVFSKTKPNDAFGGISPIVYDQVPGSSVIKYYAGIFYSISTVIKALEIIRSKGFPDAFVVAFFNGQLITTEKAREIEFAGFKL